MSRFFFAAYIFSSTNFAAASSWAYPVVSVKQTVLFTAIETTDLFPPARASKQPYIKRFRIDRSDGLYDRGLL